VITVPAYFNDSQGQATKDAGRIAGLEVLRIINEPTASALAYGLQKQSETQCVAVYDMGGGTFDISILELSEGVVEVKATSGNTHLGGDDFDQRIIDWLAEQFVEEHQIELREDRVALQRLKEAAEKAKMELSSMLRTEISLPFITADEHGPKHLQATLSRATLEQLCADLIEQSIEPVKQALEDANLTPEQIDEVILVGGQTRMPAVQQAVREFFGKEPNKTVNPDEVVAIGAAVQAGVIDGVVKDVLLLDVTPLTLGIETLGGMMAPLIERNTTIPTRKSKTVSTASDNQVAVEIHVLQGERAEVKLNKSLGKFELTDIAPGPRGVPQIEVTFDIDVNGITHVSAQDKATGKEQGITITASSGLTSEEIARMIDDAQTHREEDTQRRQHIAVQNAADSAIYAARKLLRLAGERVDETTLQTVHERIAALQAVLESDDTATIQQQTDDLSAALQPIHLILASKNGDGQQQQNGQEGEQQQQEGEQQQDRHEDPNEQHESEKT
jgi:molecular chaperone DnaK